MKIIGVVLSAGEGTRLKSSLPKFLHKVGGLELISNCIRILKLSGVDKLFFVLGHDADDAQKYIGHYPYVIQKKRKGTADAFLQAVDCLSSQYSDILVIYVDIPLIRPQTIKTIIAEHRKNDADITLATAIIDDPYGYGRVIRDQDKNIACIKEEDILSRDEKKIKEVNVGVYIFKNSPYLKTYLKKISPKGKKKEKYLTEIIPNYYRDRKKICSVVVKDPQEVLGINTRNDLAVVNKIMFLRNAWEHIDRGVTVVSPENTYIELDVKIGRDTIIYPFVYIERGVNIGKKCSIGPCSRIRGGSVLKNEVSVGNFAEIVRSHIGEGTKIRHFSYIGDARVGKNVNIGAGTVTANYDGRNKNKTFIGNNAFIGSNSTIIAPVKIGNNAVVGAGAVVTKGKNVPANSVVVGVPAKLLRRRKNG
ncbi:MAG TPA: bifunctional N-acetylglucosamine-1-phosphate uridyltransferase/glucosamine-1-phosphate acetyltransferase [Candidatus Omnitrophica bacterium]|nr:bifunctional N-acetylglucosamine-1-phosphate uridyltransferase/glucosamine-1-phosphate acetyltransferase [Candidatus Omnitrophota bacterium]